MSEKGLHWPLGWKRTEPRKRKNAQFNVAFTKARDSLLAEVRRLGGSYIVISTDLPLRRDGLPYANTAEPDDTGVAVYFKLGKEQKVFACDRWKTVRDNMQALAKTIEALRGIDRWGSSVMLERAFSAFDALPPPKTWRETFDGVRTAADLHHAYREKARKAHPDVGGSEAAMAELNAHYAEAKREFEAA